MGDWSRQDSPDLNRSASPPDPSAGAHFPGLVPDAQSAEAGEPASGEAVSKPPPGQVGIVAMGAGMAVVAIVLAAVWIAPLKALPAPRHVAWWVIAVGFAGSNIFIVHLNIRRTHLFSVGEVPLVVGLLFTSPLGVVAAWVVGGGCALAIYRRHRPVKLLFNVGSYAFEATTAVLVFRLLLGPHAGVGPAAWGPVLAAALLLNVIGVGCVTAAIAITGGGFRWGWLLGLVVTGVIVGPIANTSLALVTAALLWSDPAAVWLLAAIIAVLILAYRGYTELTARYANLQRLYDFTQALERASKSQTALQSVLSSTRQLLSAEVVQLLLVGEELPGVSVHSMHGADDELEVEHFGSPAEAGAIWDRAIAGEVSIRVHAKTRSPALRAALDEDGRRDCMVVPLRREGRVAGAILVADRLGDVSTFQDEDLRFFEALASHAAVSLENASLFDRLQYAALHDELTGLANRSLFNRLVSDAIDRRTRGTKVAVLLMDLDRFKEVNDTLGHQQGDEVLIGVAARLERALRYPATLARLGGDEFAVLLTELEDDREPTAVAERLRAVVSTPFALGGLSVAVAATIGIAIAPDDGEDATTLLQRADVAMYSAKGGDGVQSYSTDRDNYSPRRLALVSELQSAIDRGELELYYQPQADFKSGKVVGAEALLRWVHPLAGFIPPEEFIEVAERTGLIRPLTLFVLRSATAQWRKWQDAGLHLGMSVNLSARNLLDPQLIEDLSGLLEEASMPASQLTLEVTESSIMTDIERTLEVVNGLARLGVRLSIDDFGTGYSSLSYLKRLPVEEVKIDKSFVMSMESDDNDRAIVQAVILLAANLGLRVVAEGVETHSAWNMLARFGCSVAQGYVLSPPLTAAEFYLWAMAKAANGPVRVRDGLRSVR